MIRRVALFGGTFDPFHLGHFLIARWARDIFKLDRVVFIPCAQSPLKTSQPLAEDRLRLKLLRQGLRGERWAEVWTTELVRRGISYSIDTALSWKKKHPQDRLFWILGSDQWKALSRWRRPQELARLVHFLVFPRPDLPRPKRGIKMSVVPKRFDISATEIRGRLKEKLSVTGLVLLPVERQLLRQKAYR